MTEVTPMIGKKIVAAKMETDDGLRVLMLELDDGTVCEACAKTDVEVFVCSPLSQPTSPQPERQGPFIPTVQDLHALFAEEETKLEQQAKRYVCEYCMADIPAMFHEPGCPNRAKPQTVEDAWLDWKKK